jgi:dCTP deaminase
MILKTDRLAKLLRDGENATGEDPLVITPTPKDLNVLEQSGSASIDLRLGTWFVTLREARMSHLDIDKPGAQSKLTKTHFVPFGDEYHLHPRSFVLAVTLEWMRLPSNLSAYVIGKSSWGRRGLIIATATGVHPGFKGCLTLELSNVGELPIAINPGMTICQLFFHHVDTANDTLNRSNFNGCRRPALGKIEADPIARKLADAYKLPPAP